MSFPHLSLLTQFRWKSLLLGLAAMVLVGGAGWAQQGSQAATRQYALAVAAQNRGDFRRAADEWNALIVQHPADPRRDRAFYYRGLCLLKLDQHAEAADAFQAVLQHYPQSEMAPSSQLNLGMAQYGLGQRGRPESYDQAAATLAAFLARYPTSKSAPQALFYQGECLYERGQKREAAALYTTLLQRYPQASLAPDALYALAVAQQETGQHAAAEKSLDEFLRRFADHSLASEVLMRRGDALLALGQPAAAAECLKAAADRQGFELADYAAFRQAAALVQMNRHEEAAALYLSLAERWPKSPHAAAARLAAGRTLYALGRFDAARSALSTLGAPAEAALEAAHWIARSWLKENKPEEALAAADRALKAKPAGPGAVPLLLDRADALHKIPQRRAEAAAAYAKLADSHSDDPLAPQARSMAALAAFGQADYPAALAQAEDFRRRWSGHPLMPQAASVAAESALQLGKPQRAAELYAELLQKWPENSSAKSWQVRRGAALLAAGKHKEAVEAVEPALEALEPPELRAEGLYVLGRSRLELGQARPALESLQAALAAAPRGRQADEAWLALAEAQQEQDLAAESRASLERLLLEFPDSAILDRACYRLAETCYASGDLPDAAKHYQQVLQRWPKSPLCPLAFYGLAWARLAMNDHAAAEQAATRLMERYSREKLASRGHYVRALARQQSGRFEAAVDDLKAFLAAAPERSERSDARYALALCQVQLKQFDEAVASLEGLLKDDPQYAQADKALYELAWAEQSRARPGEAAEAFRRLAADHPESPLAAESLFHVAEYDYQKGDYAGAAKGYHRSCVQAGQTPLGEKAAHKLGWAYWRLDEYARAQASFAYQRDLWPKGPLQADATFMEAESLAKQGKFNEALALYTQVKDPTGKDFAVRALLGAGQAAAELKRWPESLQWLQRALEQFPQSPLGPEILCEQGWVQQNLGRPDEALRLYNQVIAATDREAAARAQFMIGRIQAEQEQPAEALKSFFKVAYGYSYSKWQADATYEAGRCYETLGKTGQAVKQYEELGQKHAGSDKVGPARKRLEALRGENPPKPR